MLPAAAVVTQELHIVEARRGDTLRAAFNVFFSAGLDVAETCAFADCATSLLTLSSVTATAVSEEEGERDKLRAHQDVALALLAMGADFSALWTGAQQAWERAATASL
jgi:bifunctional ADP-heptose synthase (sugar kinase/adenylyltransferase)